MTHSVGYDMRNRYEEESAMLLLAARKDFGPCAV
jgi:hypothetical protein